MVARHLPYSKSTIKRYWEKEGLDFTNNRNVLSQDDIGKIIGAYDGWNGNASRAGRALGYSTSSVLKYWKAAGLDISRARIKNPPRRKEMSA